MRCKIAYRCAHPWCVNCRSCLADDLWPQAKPKTRPLIGKRAAALVRSGHEQKCKSCGTTKELTFDHIIPLDKGGPDTNDNGQILCARCNSIKGNQILTIEELKIQVDNGGR